jgi:hypothetical protein
MLPHGFEASQEPLIFRLKHDRIHGLVLLHYFSLT